jgi:hypothetical protein
MTLVLAHTMAVLDISLPAVEVSHNNDESGKPKHVIDEPRSGCVNIESVVPSEQVSHLPTSINEDGTNIEGKEGFPQFQKKVEGKSND